MIRFAFAASLLALAACQPPASAPEAAKPAETATAAPPAGAPPAAADAWTGACSAHVEKVWIDQPNRYTSEAAVLGSTCKNGVALLIVRQADGRPIYSWAGSVDFLFGLKDATDAASMETALSEWIDQGDPKKPDATATLPAWEETEGQPKRAEFPFMPIEGTTRASWNNLKKENLPMFCFPQGSESSQCAVLRPSPSPADVPDSLEEIGVQLFPG